jgi:hypothetical protein
LIKSAKAIGLARSFSLKNLASLEIGRNFEERSLDDVIQAQTAMGSFKMLGNSSPQLRRTGP